MPRNSAARVAHENIDREHALHRSELASPHLSTIELGASSEGRRYTT